MPKKSGIISVEVAKYIGMVLGAFAFFAGICDWFVIGTWRELWHESHRRPTRFAPTRPLTGLLELAIIATLVCLSLHAIVYFLRIWLTRRGGLVGMGATAWRILFAGCHIAGFILGIWIYLASVRGS